MSEQLSFAIPRARTTDPETSHQAAASVKGLRESQRAVLELFEAWGMMTDERVAQNYPSPRRPRQSPSGLRTRRKELVDAGYLEDSGIRQRMETGRMAIVWKLV